MIYRLFVPTTIEDNDAVRVLEWHGAEGEAIAPGALIIEVETHKALIEVRAAQGGILRVRRVEEGGWCALGAVLGIFSDAPDEPIAEGDTALAADFLIC